MVGEFSPSLAEVLAILKKIKFNRIFIYKANRMATNAKDFKALESKLEMKLNNLNTDFDETKEILNTMNNYLMHDKAVEKMKKLAVKYETINSDIIKINVGGTYFSTLKATLEKKIKKNKDEYYEPHLLQSIVSGMVKIIYDETKAIFLDRNPKYFGYGYPVTFVKDFFVI